MDISSKLKINNSEDVRHQLHIVDIPLSIFKKKRSKCFLMVKKKYTFQKAVVKITFDKSIIEDRQNINKDSIAISFDHDNNKVDIFIDKQVVDKDFIKIMGRYHIKYTPIDSDSISVKVKTYFKQVFYRDTIQSRIKNLKSKEELINSQRLNEGTYTVGDLRRRDLQSADKFPYEYSPNSDGNRSRREVFGGTFSGISRSGGKRK